MQRKAPEPVKMVVSCYHDPVVNRTIKDSANLPIIENILVGPKGLISQNEQEKALGNASDDQRIVDFMTAYIDRLYDAKVVRSLLSDCLPDKALERNLLINAYSEGYE